MRSRGEGWTHDAGRTLAIVTLVGHFGAGPYGPGMGAGPLAGAGSDGSITCWSCGYVAPAVADYQRLGADPSAAIAVPRNRSIHQLSCLTAYVTMALGPRLLVR